ncbi:MAG TPA: asparagine synthase-related protein [Geobacteraceae bacterium]
MSGIFGIFNRDGSPVAGSTLATMRHAMAQWGPDGCDILLDGPAGLGQARLCSTPEARREKMPIKQEGILFAAAGRVDNREELIGQLAIRGQPALIPDSDVILHAYLKWGEECPVRIYGDWSFAAWHPGERRLFLARDHYGNTALYYYVDPGVFAFASSRKALLALNLAPIEMDELYLAQVLVTWPACHGDRTFHKPVKRLPPAHCIAVTVERMTVRQYWRLEDTAELHLPRRGDYVEAFREIFDEAVRCRLRSAGNVAVTLSGGLDSGSVAATAAKYLHLRNDRLLAFTSVPLSDTDKYVGERFGDEFPFAQATAGYAGNIDLHRNAAETITPIRAIRSMLALNNEPAHAAGNYYWLQAIRQAAAAHGCRVLLTGQAGNAGISWTGMPFSQSMAFQLSQFGWRRWPKELAKQYAPASMLSTYRKLRKTQNDWWKSSAIHPDLGRRLNLPEQMRSDPHHYPRTSREHRCGIIKPGRSFLGFLHAESGAAYGLELRDPTADARVLAFTLSVPDHIFIDPGTGMDRWLIREAMKGRLPDEVRLNRKRGRQAGDLVPRLRACASEVETALEELASGAAAAYVNVPYMREVWAMVKSEDTPEAFHKSVTILTRGIMAGLSVNGFDNAS